MDKVLITALATLLAAVSLADTAQDAADAAASAQSARLAAADAKFYADKIVDAQDAASASASEAKTAAAEAKGVKRYLDQEIESALEDIGEAKTTAESAIEAKKDSELAQMQGFATNFEQQIKDGHVTYTTNHVYETNEYEYKYLYQYQNYNVTTNVNMTLPANYSVIYTSGGKRRENMHVFSEANLDGRLRVNQTLTSGEKGTTYGLVVTLRYYYGTTYRTVDVPFHISYFDNDINGMRIHYVADSVPAITATNSSTLLDIVFKYFYWQDGVIYIRAEALRRDTGALYAYAVSKYSYDDNEKTFPNTFTGSRSFVWVEGTQESRFSARTYQTGTAVVNGVFLNEDPPADDLPMIKWMKTGVLPENQ